MPSAPQLTAIVIGLVVFAGLTIPGITRVVLLGAVAIVLGIAIFLNGGFLPPLPH